MLAPGHVEFGVCHIEFTSGHVQRKREEKKVKWTKDTVCAHKNLT